MHLTGRYIACLCRTKARVANWPLISIKVDEIADQILTLVDTTIESGWVSRVLCIVRNQHTCPFLTRTPLQRYPLPLWLVERPHRCSYETPFGSQAIPREEMTTFAEQVLIDDETVASCVDADWRVVAGPCRSEMKVTAIEQRGSVIRYEERWNEER